MSDQYVFDLEIQPLNDGGDHLVVIRIGALQVSGLIKEKHLLQLLRGESIRPKLFSIHGMAKRRGRKSMAVLDENSLNVEKLLIATNQPSPISDEGSHV